MIHETRRILEAHRAGEKQAKGDPDTQAELVEKKLAKLSPSEIIDFDRKLRKHIDEAYRWDLWAAAYIVNGGCGDDSFEYFRAWLIAQGQKVFKNALRDPQSLAAVKGIEDEEVDCELLLYASTNAYQNKTGKEMPWTGPPWGREPTGKRWEKEELERMYPKLWKKFAD